MALLLLLPPVLLLQQIMLIARITLVIFMEIYQAVFQWSSLDSPKKFVLYLLYLLKLTDDAIGNYCREK